MKSFGEKVVELNMNVSFEGTLPKGFKTLNPFRENPETRSIMKQFYRKYYNDTEKRKFIVAINPGRLGAGTTGIPFTDTKRLEKYCGIKMKSAYTHEVSAVFVYHLIEEMGGVEAFYKKFYINSLFPLAIVKENKKGKWVNANYYDDKSLFERVKSKIITSLKANLSLGIDTSEVFVLGKKNATFLKRINDEINLVDKYTVLEHPRYIQQYKLKEVDNYIEKFKRVLLA